MNSKRFYGAALMGAIMIPVALTACGDDPLGAVCCDEFKVGAGITGDIGGSAESKVAVQAVADFAGIASAAVDDITTACRGIATDLDAAQAERDAAEATADRNGRMNAWCQLAVKSITTVKAAAQATIKITPPVCEASVSAKANCQASCSGGVKCDVKATPPTCEGGKLEVSCSGSCTAEAGATLQCEGSCEANCEGSCTAQGGVKCAGECNGTCEGNTANGTATGKCEGTCKGTCSVTPPGVKCEGSCNGKCSGTCKASAGASVKCDGKCDVAAEPLRCQGGTLKGGCTADAKCDANCDASVKAKAECRPPALEFAFTGNVEAAGKLKATLDANLGVIAAFQARLKGMVDVSGTFSANVGAVADIKVACIPPVVAAVGTAVGQVQASATASLSIVSEATK